MGYGWGAHASRHNDILLQEPSLKPLGSILPPNRAPIMPRVGVSSRAAPGQIVLHCEKFCNINDTFDRVIGTLVNWHGSTGILTRIARAILIKFTNEMYQFTRIPMTRLNKFLMLQNLSQYRNLGRKFTTSLCIRIAF